MSGNYDFCILKCSLGFVINRRINLTVVVGLLLLVANPSVNAQSADSIANLMFGKTRQIKTLSYTMTKEERINGELQKQVAFVKLNRDPFKVYTKQITPNDGLEVLYRTGDESALINPNGFPWFNIKLDPLGHRMTKDQHHTIFDSGFDKFIAIFEHLFDKYGEDIDKMATVKNHITENGKRCWKLVLNNSNFKLIDYVVQENEDLMEIAEKRYISAYMILEINKEIEDYDDITPGQVIKIPSDYSPKMTLLIDKRTYVPDEIVVYDEVSLFENYQFSNITINPLFSPDEFTAEYGAYGF